MTHNHFHVAAGSTHTNQGARADAAWAWQHVLSEEPTKV